MDPQEQRKRQEAELQKALEAARNRDARAFLTAVAASHALDGVMRSMRWRWPGIDDEEIHSAVSTAADALFDKVAGGDIVRSPAGYLFKAAEKSLLNRYRKRQQETEFNDEREYEDTDGGEADIRRDTLRAEALKIARSLLPDIGEENLQRVMAVILDAVERGEFELTNEQIAEAVGLSTEAVRKLKSRGFGRIRRAALKRGIKLEDYITTSDAEEDNEGFEGS